MSEWTLKSALEFALKKEEESINLYTSAQQKAEFPGSKVFLKELVEEELKSFMEENGLEWKATNLTKLIKKLSFEQIVKKVDEVL